MDGPRREGEPKRLYHGNGAQFAGVHEQHHIHQIAHARVSAPNPGEGVGVYLLCEELGSGQHEHSDRRDAGEARKS